jgi:hypothetical protein
VRIDTSGNLLVGKTASGVANSGAELQSSGFTSITRDGGPPLQLNRKTSDGDIAVLKKDGTTVGSISSSSGKIAITLDPRSAATTGSGFLGGDGVIFPSDKTGVASDADVSLGGASTRFKDLYLSSNVYLGGSDGTSTIFSPTSFAIDIDSNNDQTDRAFVIKNNGSNDIARFTEAGNFLVGTTSLDIANNGSNTGFVVNSNGALEVGSSATVLTLNRQSTNGDATRFQRGGTTVGSISVTGSGTTYNTTSDIRLKTDIAPIADATDKLMAMNPVSHKWKADPDADAVHGFIAQEIQEIVPEAVSKGDNEDDMWSMDYGRITPVLVAALQDAHKKIEELATEVAKLKAN